MPLAREAGFSRIRTQAFILGAIPVAFFLILLMAAIGFRSQTEKTAAWVQRSEGILDVERDLSSSVIRADFRLIHDIGQPDAVHTRSLQAALRLEPLARHLLMLVRDDPVQKRRAASIAALVHEFVRTYRAAAAAYAGHDLPGARRIISSPDAQHFYTAWITQTAAFEDSETALRPARWARLQREYQIFGWVMVLGTLIGMGLTMLSAVAFGRRIVSRIERLAAAARRMASEEALPDVVQDDDEIAELGRVYHEMAQFMRHREMQLEKYRLLAKHARDIILFIRPRDGRIVEANAAAERAYGYSTDELERLCARDLRAPEAAHRIDAELERAREAPLVFETVHRRRDGQTFPVEIAAQSAVVDGEQIILEIVRDISERRIAQQELNAALTQAVQASRLKSEFLAAMSHEIRTPLNAVIGMTELLTHSGLAADQRHCAAVAHDSGEALLHLINDILDFSKIEAQRLDLEIIEFNLVAVVEGVAGMFISAAAQNHVALMTYVSPLIPQVLLGDPGRLRQVLTNLAGNAVKFTKNGYVVITADAHRQSEESAQVLFSVKDSGIGIAAEAIPALFEPFRQADGSMARRYGGTGLGLSISKGLVELMGGSIAVESEPGAGSTFSFMINFKLAPNRPLELPDLSRMRALVVGDPLAQDIFGRYMTSWRMRCDTVGEVAGAYRLAEEAAAGADPYDVILLDLPMPEMDGFKFARRMQSALDSTQTRLILVTPHDEPERGAAAIAAGFCAYLTKPVRQSQLYDCIVNASAVAAPLEIAPSSGAEARSGRRILVAEDNEINRDVALRQLAKLGYAAQTVADGDQAVKAALSGQFDLVLMDCQMPVMDGFQATRAIRKGEAHRGSRIRIVAMTANALAEDRQACLDAGMDDYLAKPVTLGALRRVLARAGAEGPLDDARLNDLFEGDPRGMSEFLAEALPALLRLIRQLEDAAEPSGRRAAAHELKGAAANAGALEIAQIAEDIETALRLQSDASPLIARLFEAHRRAVSAARTLTEEA